jgi:6-phosphogluconolactonase
MSVVSTPSGAALQVADTEQTFAAAAARVLEAGIAAQAEGRDFMLALAGGETPRALYARLAQAATTLEWTRVVWCWGDERCVPPTDVASNYRMVHEALLAHIPARGERVLRVETEHSPGEAAHRYEQTLRTLFVTPHGAPLREPGRCFDLVLLGLGPDGHTASLFPHAPALQERERWALDTPAPAPGPLRVTLSVPVIAAAREVVVLASGASKREALRGTLFGAHDPARWPLQAIAAEARSLTVLADRAAAA